LVYRYFDNFFSFFKLVKEVIEILKCIFYTGYGYGYGAYAGYPYTYGAHYIGKRSADAEPKAEAQYYGAYGLGE